MEAGPERGWNEGTIVPAFSFRTRFTKKILKINKSNAIIVSFFCSLIYRKDLRLSELLMHISNSNSMVLELNAGCVEPGLSGGGTHG